MKKFAVLFMLIATGVVLAPAVWAKAGYVTDFLVVTVRDRAADGAEVLAHLKSNEAVEVLGEEGDYIKVRTKNGEEGFVQRQYITDKTPKPLIISRLQNSEQKQQRRIADLEKQLQTIKGDLGSVEKEQAAQIVTLQGAAAGLEKELNLTQQKLKAVSQKYDKLLKNSQEVITITQERDRLQQDNTEMVAQVDSLQEENNKLARSGMIQWFLAGAGVLLVGWLIGKASGGRKRSSFGSL